MGALLDVAVICNTIMGALLDVAVICNINTSPSF